MLTPALADPRSSSVPCVLPPTKPPLKKRLQVLVDIGANLTHDSFDRDREQVIARALAAGVGHMVVTGSGVAESGYAADLAAARPDCLSATAGIHPHHASELQPDSIDELAALLAREEVVAAGECGLDFFRNFSPRDKQIEAFEAQLELAARIQMPVFLHQRDAHAEFMAILKPWRDALPRAVAHCFTGSREELRDYLDLDLHIGITGWICDERRGLHLREFVGDIPASRLMIETDAPYLLPRDLQPKPKGRRNEPMHLPHILHTLATCLGRDTAGLGEETTRTACRFFDLQVTP